MSSKREEPLVFFLRLTDDFAAGLGVALAVTFGLGLTRGLDFDFTAGLGVFFAVTFGLDLDLTAGLAVTLDFRLTGDLALDFATGFFAFPAMNGPQQQG